ncbi:MAG: ribosome biogenesis factor YjgA [Sedimenticolaceae bacterium]
MSDERPDPRPSKSARKRDLEALQKLAEQMTLLSDAELQRLGVDERLRSAMDLVRPMRPSGARNRQLRHCTKFMDNTTLADVRYYLADRQSRRLAANRELHAIERWRDRLVSEGDKALQSLLENYEVLDRQHLRQLCRDAGREKETGKPAGAGRKLFRYLREALPVAGEKR